MLEPLTALQSLYWQKQSLLDSLFGVERRINSLRKHNKQPRTLLYTRNSLIDKIDEISTQMVLTETVYTQMLV